ncbi:MULTISPECIES: MarR family winged helix-turn-helix transcriptional regulator [unclassified Streptomyces]|uniref:MarR family winged helix-turn-helix transcriptional regulator n=1 Tax=unclassified Streptomyces TaxID=2593676 RepID=UPI0035D654A2
MTDTVFPTIGYLAWQLSQNIAGKLERELRALDLTLAQYNALLHTVRTPGLSSADIARRSGLTAQSMGAAVIQLIERGLLRREPHPTSRRSMCLFATEEGHAATAHADAVAGRITAEATSHFSQADNAILHRLLYRLVEELNPDSLAPGARPQALTGPEQP